MKTVLSILNAVQACAFLLVDIGYKILLFFVLKDAQISHVVIVIVSHHCSSPCIIIFLHNRLHFFLGAVICMLHL